MTEDALVGMLTCDRCNHAIGAHEGDGCSEPTCRCGSTMEDVLAGNIDVATREYRATFGME